jgi:hypothetical protein
MTELLKKAFDEASRLREQEQDQIARWLLAELTSERRWDQAFDHSQNGLETLANEALREHRAGHTQDLDPDRM